MNFVKTYIYKQEITNDGIRELEKDARSVKEIDENKILKELPEFKRDNQFLSLSEQLDLNKNNKVTTQDDNDDGGNVNAYGLPILTEEYIEYYESYTKNDHYSTEKLREREKEIQHEFKEALKSCVKKKELMEEKNNLVILKEGNSINFREVKKNVIIKKKTSDLKSTVKAIIKTKKKKDSNIPLNEDTDIKEGKDNQTGGDDTHSNTRVRDSLLCGYSDNSDE
ncbi:conserved Plasmodium protein, unknown function [Plasmodium ovale wallikeri]|uniref:Uncharacterized protein n=2 Tax=Plasmodium ovale TaxID=36330 RepID=A0A1A8YQU9_PLAOA|nr:conserved Plasmodium protein, unknown function [Plasmodium ovale wallikeri]SBT34524.1 conserved Plasmodium protein, unknown function [Plasmodium ovale wallikeri]SBT76630.1 conserved Plasmodium protein, unknown function [Plasmodium ovale]